MSAWGGFWSAGSILLAAYLLGSIPWSYLVVRIFRKEDIRAVGSGNVGATNAMRAAGKAVGAAALALDVAKGVAAVLVARRFDAPPLVVGTAAVTVVLGHVFPVFLGFRGGKGVATAAGALGALAPAVMAVALLLFFLIVSWKRYVSLGSIAVAALFPLLAWIGDRLGWVEEGGPWLVLSSGAIGAIILARHASNLRRLIHGTERRLGESRVRPAGKEG